MYPWKTWQGMTLIIKVCLLWRVLACGILPAVTLGSCILFGCSRLYSFLFLPSVVTYSAQKLQAQRDGLLVVRKNKKPRQGRTAAPGFSHALWRLLCTTARPAARRGRLCAPLGGFSCAGGIPVPLRPVAAPVGISGGLAGIWA